jgi:hypothetical protein
MTGKRSAHPRPPSAAPNPASTARPRHPSAALPSPPSATHPRPPSAPQTRPILDTSRPTKHILLPPNLLIRCYLFLVFFQILKKKNTRISYVNFLFFMFPYRLALFFLEIKFSNCRYMYYRVTAYTYMYIYGYVKSS